MKHNDDSGKNAAPSGAPLEELVFQALSKRGEIIPETLEEVSRAEAFLESHPPTLPESLRDPRRLLALIKAKRLERGSKLVPFPESSASKVEQELAFAARNGAKISPEVRDRMRANRTKALDSRRGRSSS